VWVFDKTFLQLGRMLKSVHCSSLDVRERRFRKDVCLLLPGSESFSTWLGGMAPAGGEVWRDVLLFWVMNTSYSMPSVRLSRILSLRILTT